MASPSMQRSNDENRTPAKHTPKQSTAHITNRAALGDVSPNVKAATPAFLRKPMAGSPLKRSFTAAMEGGGGLMYLKKRKLSEDEVLSQVDGVQEQGPGTGGVKAVHARTISLIDDEDEVLDRIPADAEPSPTEPNTPSDNDDSTEDSSAERKSFSSLINYDPSSQTTSNLVFKFVSNAEMLKLRLRVALYKVRTNQIDVPFAELLVEDRQWKARQTHDAIEEVVAALRQEAQQVSKHELNSSVPRLLPAPVLKPTAYSSRMIYATDLPSSPPVTGSPEKPAGSSERLHMAPVGMSTPQRLARMLSSPPTSPQRSRGAPTEQELTSSVVKGRVAEGLLGLRNAVA